MSTGATATRAGRASTARTGGPRVRTASTSSSPQQSEQDMPHAHRSRGGVAQAWCCPAVPIHMVMTTCLATVKPKIVTFANFAHLTRRFTSRALRCKHVFPSTYCTARTLLCPLGMTTTQTKETTMTKTYTIRYTDGRGTRTCSDYYTEVLGILAETIGEDVEVGDEEQDGMVDEDGGRPMRRLVWACEDDSDGDDGAKAVASVRWTE